MNTVSLLKNTVTCNIVLGIINAMKKNRKQGKGQRKWREIQFQGQWLGKMFLKKCHLNRDLNEMRV